MAVSCVTWSVATTHSFTTAAITLFSETSDFPTNTNRRTQHDEINFPPV
jgi:hypothetical protein